MTTLETLFSPMQKEKLRQAALVRTSCRSFAGAPDTDRKSTRLNSSHMPKSRMPSSA